MLLFETRRCEAKSATTLVDRRALRPRMKPVTRLGQARRTENGYSALWRWAFVSWLHHFERGDPAEDSAPAVRPRFHTSARATT